VVRLYGMINIIPIGLDTVSIDCNMNSLNGTGYLAPRPSPLSPTRVESNGLKKSVWMVLETYALLFTVLVLPS
jgi:hypothetical protein